MKSLGSGQFAVGTLDALTRELVRLPLPEVEWDRIERNLFADIAARSRPAPPVAAARASSHRGVSSPWTIALVAAAAVAAIVRMVPQSETRAAAPAEPQRVMMDEDRAALRSMPATPRTAPAGTGPLVAPLQSGDVAVSGAEPVHYEQRGSVRFTLAPASHAVVVSVEESSDKAAESPSSLTIALLEGSIHAEVEPREVGEAFAIEVGQTRIAVHGTSFSVSRQGDRAVVEVAHGSVAVGPTGHPGATQGWLLVGPDRASFSLDGGKEATWLGAPALEQPVASNASEGLPAAREPADDAGGSYASAPRAVSNVRGGAARVSSGARDKNPRAGGDDAERKRAVSAVILAKLQSCYERQSISLGVRFSVKSSLALTVRSNGSVQEGLFDPPLSPTLMTCARDAIAAARFPHEPAPFTVRLPVELSTSP